MLLGLRFLKTVPLAKKVVSYVTQANVRLPDRLNTYNLLAQARHRGSAHVRVSGRGRSTEAPVNAQRAVWEETNAQALVNRMLAYDWKYTLADNDLPKVCGTAALAEIDVGFPLLSDDLVDFSLRLEPTLKLKGFKLRYFFKEALRDFLPPEIISKKKHGFGLPFGVWLTRHSGLQALVRSIVQYPEPQRTRQPGFSREPALATPCRASGLLRRDGVAARDAGAVVCCPRAALFHELAAGAGEITTREIT